MTQLSEINEAFNDRNVSANEYSRLRDSWFIDRGLGTETIDDTMRYIERLEEICSETYQVVGVLSAECGMFEDPQTQRVLDNLSQLKKVHETVLPYVVKHEREEAR